ncbi:TetR/AcrR family transcriptional regulator [Amycolatopsis anabasis]|uniref:TetR/AcrR family transcriptional regulator n=1 Tax=Amycolatopsis anabasis TaxID=1840409 RepID=UPI00131E2D12|nr:TetR/AcrR family transcriptional regulator [Amycolatopsis anabasis]
MEDSAVPAPAPKRLPPGRHGLVREQVVASQRERLLAAMAEVTAEKGYGATTVADVLNRAGVSRLTFYQHFFNKQDCFTAAYDAAVTALTDVLTQALDGGGGPWDAVERSIGAYLDTLAAEPVLARLFLVEAYAVGPEFLLRRTAFHTSVIETLAQLTGAATPQQRLTCEALVGAVVSMATTRIAQGDLAALSTLRTPLSELVRALARTFDEGHPEPDAHIDQSG